MVPVRARPHLVATREFREFAEQQVPLLDDVRFIEGPGEQSPSDMESLVAEKTLDETEIPRRGLGFVVPDCDGELIARSYDIRTGGWV